MNVKAKKQTDKSSVRDFPSSASFWVACIKMAVRVFIYKNVRLEFPAKSRVSHEVVHETF